MRTRVDRTFGEELGSKRDLVGVDRVCVRSGVGLGRGHHPCLGERWSGLRPLAAEERDIIGDDLTDASFFAFFILEAAVLQASLDVERVILLDVLGCCLGEALPAVDAVVLGLFLAVDEPIGRETDRTDGLATGRVPQLGVARGVADQDDLIDTAHRVHILHNY